MRAKDLGVGVQGFGILNNCHVSKQLKSATRHGTKQYSIDFAVDLDSKKTYF